MNVLTHQVSTIASFEFFCEHHILLYLSLAMLMKFMRLLIEVRLVLLALTFFLEATDKHVFGV